MSNFYIIKPNGQKQGPISEQRLKELAASGLLEPNTLLETESGHKGTAEQIRGLFVKPIDPSAVVIQNDDKPSESVDPSAVEIRKNKRTDTNETNSTRPITQYQSSFKGSCSGTFVGLIGVIVVCLAMFDMLSAKIQEGSRETALMQSYSNNTYGSFSAPNDVETNKSKYMYELAIAIEKHLKMQSAQRLQLDIILICFGSLLFACSRLIDR